MFVQENNPILPPLVDPWITEFLKNKKDIFNLVEAYGPSMNIHYPYLFLQNQTSFSEVFEKYNLKYRMLFPRKASRCKRIGKLAAGNGIGAVVSTPSELLQCLKEYDNSDQILVSTPVLTDELIRLAVENNLCLVVDAIEDCETIQKIGIELDKTAQIGIRLTKFKSYKETSGQERGFCPNEAFFLLTERFGKLWTQLVFCGFHFQMEEFCLTKKAEAIRHTLVIIELLHRKGIKTKYIDIGDAFPVNYIADQKYWGNYHLYLKKLFRGESAAQPFQQNEMLNPKQETVPTEVVKLYPYFNKFPKEAFLDKLLVQPFSLHELLFQALRSRNIELIVQPGRSLLDQTGVSLAKITAVEMKENRTYEISLQLDQIQLNKLKVDYLLDPIYISQEDGFAPQPVIGNLVTQTSGKKEPVLKRKINFPKIPAVNDVVCFVNTSGYALHLNDMETNPSHSSKHIFISAAESQWNYELVAS
jgi:diaminopimelate decarboxylase